MTGLAHQLGISRQALRRRLDHGGWKYDELERLAHALDMTVDQLVSDADESPTRNVPSDEGPASTSARKTRGRFASYPGQSDENDTTVSTAP